MLKFHPNEKVEVFVDGANFHSTCRSIELDVDFKKFKAMFQNSGARLIRVNYYTALLDNSDSPSLRPLVDWLDYNGYNVIVKRAKEITTATGSYIKGNIEMELALDAVDQSAFVDHIVLVTGDGAFAPLVRNLQKRGNAVTVLSSLTRPSSLADELRRAADHFVDLDTLRDQLSRGRDDR